MLLPEKSALCPWLAPKPSRMLRAFLWGVHALSILAASLNPLPIGFRLAFSACVLISLWWALRRDRVGAGITGLQIKPDGSWIVHKGDAEEEATLLGSSLVNPWFVLLHLRTETRRLALLVCRDSLPPDAFRRLRVALKIADRSGGNKTLNP